MSNALVTAFVHLC